MSSPGRTGVDAGWLAVIRVQIFVIDAVDAESAFFHHTAVTIELPRAIGAGPGTQFATNTLVFFDQDDAVLAAFVRRPGGADRNTGCVLAMQAGSGKI